MVHRAGPLWPAVAGRRHSASLAASDLHRKLLNADGIYATAPYANTVYNGRRIYDYQAGDPQTRIWFMLYAQVLQADGASWRNVLLTHKEGFTLPNPPKLGRIPATIVQS